MNLFMTITTNPNSVMDKFIFVIRFKDTSVVMILFRNQVMKSQENISITEFAI